MKNEKGQRKSIKAQSILAKKYYIWGSLFLLLLCSSCFWCFMPWRFDSNPKQMIDSEFSKAWMSTSEFDRVKWIPTLIQKKWDHKSDTLVPLNHGRLKNKNISEVQELLGESQLRENKTKGYMELWYDLGIKTETNRFNMFLEIINMDSPGIYYSTLMITFDEEGIVNNVEVSFYH